MSSLGKNLKLASIPVFLTTSHHINPSSQKVAMAKDKSEADVSAKKEKKDKKRKSSEAFDTPAAINEQPAATKKEKKSKKERKPAEDVEEIVPDTAKAEDGEENKKAEAVKLDIPLAALVPFANPLCDEKAQKKVLKGVKKGKPRTFHHHISLIAH